MHRAIAKAAIFFKLRFV